MSTNHFPAPNPPSDAISAVKFSPHSDSSKLLVASWDKNSYLYNIGPDDNADSKTSCSLINVYEHQAPLLDVCFGASDDEFYSGGLDWDVRRIDVKTSAQTVLSAHEAPVKAVTYSREHNLLISASWDATLHVHHFAPSSSSPLATVIIPLPNKVFAMSSTSTKLVVAMSSRLFHIYEISELAKTSTTFDAPAPLPNSPSPSTASTPIRKIDVEPHQRREGSLKFMTRAVATMPTDLGYASSSIEGRVAVEWFDASPESQARKYAFKCHRQTQPASIAATSTANGVGGTHTNANNDISTDQDEIDVVYPVNALTFHPVHGTFASGGGDGVVALWDGIAKRRIRQYPKYPSSVAALSFSGNGKYLAVGICPGFEDGKDGKEEEDDGYVLVDGVGGGRGMAALYIRELGPTEARGKGAK